MKEHHKTGCGLRVVVGLLVLLGSVYTAYIIRVTEIRWTAQMMWTEYKEQNALNGQRKAEKWLSKGLPATKLHGCINEINWQKEAALHTSACSPII